MTDEPLSPAMMSALQAVARMKGDSVIAWPVLVAFLASMREETDEQDDQCLPRV